MLKRCRTVVCPGLSTGRRRQWSIITCAADACQTSIHPHVSKAISRCLSVRCAPAPPTQGYSSLTLLEQGFNFDHTKALLRLLRNRGVLTALPVTEKEQLAAWLTGRQLFGSATYFFQIVGARRCVLVLATALRSTCCKTVAIVAYEFFTWCAGSTWCGAWKLLHIKVVYI